MWLQLLKLYMQELTIVIWPIYDILCLKCGVDSLEQQNSVIIISPSYHQLAVASVQNKQETQLLYSLAT